MVGNPACGANDLILICGQATGGEACCCVVAGDFAGDNFAVLAVRWLVAMDLETPGLSA